MTGAPAIYRCLHGRSTEPAGRLTRPADSCMIDAGNEALAMRRRFLLGLVADGLAAARPVVAFRRDESSDGAEDEGSDRAGNLAALDPDCRSAGHDEDETRRGEAR